MLALHWLAVLQLKIRLLHFLELFPRLSDNWSTYTADCLLMLYQDVEGVHLNDKPQSPRLQNYSFILGLKLKAFISATWGRSLGAVHFIPPLTSPSLPLLSLSLPQVVPQPQHHHWAHTPVQHEVHAVQSQGLLLAGSLQTGEGEPLIADTLSCFDSDILLSFPFLFSSKVRLLTPLSTLGYNHHFWVVCNTAVICEQWFREQWFILLHTTKYILHEIDKAIYIGISLLCIFLFMQEISETCPCLFS